MSKETVILFGDKSDPEVKESLKKILAGGRPAIITRRQSHDTGLGACGKHLCHCNGICQEEYANKLNQKAS